MTQEAQNSLLKALEEPPSDTAIILTTASLQSLLPTVRSRAQAVTVLPVSLDNSMPYFAAQDFSNSQIEKAHVLSGGYVGLMKALLEQNHKHPLFEQIEQAKQLLTSSKFERLMRVDELSKSKTELPMLFHSLSLVCKAALSRTATSSPSQSPKLIASLGAIENAHKAYLHSANNKLLLTNLFLNL